MGHTNRTDVHSTEQRLLYPSHTARHTPTVCTRPRPTTRRTLKLRSSFSHKSKLTYAGSQEKTTPSTTRNMALTIRTPKPTSTRTRQVSRAPRYTGTYPGERIAVDFHDFEQGYERSKTMALFVDRVTGIMWDYYLSERTAETITACFKQLIKMFQVHTMRSST